MSRRKPHSTSLVLLLICIFAFWWGISVLSQYTSTPLNATYAARQNNASNSGPLRVEETVADNTYTYDGTFIPNSMCDSFGSGIKYSASNGGHVSIILITTPAQVDCAQAAGLTAETGDKFSVSIKVPTGIRPSFDGIILNGSVIPSVLIAAN